MRQSTLLRAAVTLLGVGLLLQALGWITVPARAAAGLGMPLLEGMGRSTQIGDLMAFFLVAGATAVIGALPGRSAVLYVPASLLAAAALGRTLAWALHGASFAAAFIAVEVLGALLLLAAARRLGASI